MSDNPSGNTRIYQDIEQLLARTPIIQDASSLDLLVFLYRHPHTLLTNEQLAAFVGCEMKLIAKSIDAFIDVGLVERTQNLTYGQKFHSCCANVPTHA